MAMTDREKEWADKMRRFIKAELKRADVTYADLAKPSAAVAPFSYRAVSPDLFNGILRSAMQPDPRRLTHAASERTE